MNLLQYLRYRVREWGDLFQKEFDDAMVLVERSYRSSVYHRPEKNVPSVGVTGTDLPTWEDDAQEERKEEPREI